jgi:aminopeptidase YwaD
MVKVIRIIALLLYANVGLNAQNLNYARKVINDLCAPEMYGRGYVKKGDFIAAKYIREELKAAKVKSFNTEYFQEFGFPVSLYEDEVKIEVDNQSLIPGDHFIVSAGCPPVEGTFKLIWIDSAIIDNQSTFSQLEKQYLRQAFLVIGEVKNQKLNHPERLKQITLNALKAKGIIYAAEKKLTWSVSTKWDDFAKIYVKEGLLKPYQTTAKIIVSSQIKSHSTQNVIGYIEGSKFKDSFLVFTAHYDHLGMMGKEAIFPGANDNASGVAMLLDLVNHYSKNKPEYNIAFMFFAGEEAGLFGSYFYTQNPLFPLKQISLLLNLDLMGTGDKGLTAVNATVFPDEFQELQLVNMDGDFLPTIVSRGKAQNSDHHYFTENGVKSFFFYLMGDYHFYHDVDDKADALPLSKYNEAFKLIHQFADAYQKAH